MNGMKVELVDHMGTDLSVVNAARVSFDKQSAWERPRADYTGPDGHARADERLVLSSKDAKLISYLARHGHWSPFAHTSITLRVKAPIFVARQLQKHQVGFSWNEVSRRYVDDTPEFYAPSRWRRRAPSAKQGSGEDLDEGIVYGQVGASIQLRRAHEACMASYTELLGMGVAPEQARMVLPQSMFTEWIWTGNVFGFSRVYRQRSDEHAQREVQVIAAAIDDVIAPLFPVSWKALTS